MGQTLSEPVTEKHSESGRNDRLIYGASAMQGWRSTMEDAHTAVLNVGGKSESSGNQMAFFGVYDGHGGDRIAKYVGNRLHLKLNESESFKAGYYGEALKETFLGIDEELLQSRDLPFGVEIVIELMCAL
jgi:protein phosphatase PTC2/3